MKAILSRVLLGLALAAFAIGASAQQAKNPEYGTWKLNVEKSKFNPGPPPKSNTIVMEPWQGDGVKYTSKGVNAEGKPTGQEYTGKYDGKDVPLAGSPTANSTSMRMIDAWTVERVNKKDGKVVTTFRREYSKDGKTFTAKNKGTNAKGETFNDELLWERM